MRTTARPLIFGEVLFDQFPDGQRVLGGAPFNVAWNLRGLGLSPLFLSAVGNDPEGEEVCTKMQAWGMETSGLQVTKIAPTGAVQVTLQDGDPQFDILPRQAYDYIEFPPIEVSPAEFSLLYFGSLIYRHEKSRATLRHLIQTSNLPCFIDVNIREPWFDTAWLPDLLEHAAWVKLSLHELIRLAEGKPAGPTKEMTPEVIEAVQTVRQRYGGRDFFITCGAAGAYAVPQEGEIAFAQPPRLDNIVDPVGAGDAFAAATIFGITHNFSLLKMLQTAGNYASNLCTIQGATSMDRKHYAFTGAES